MDYHVPLRSTSTVGGTVFFSCSVCALARIVREATLCRSAIEKLFFSRQAWVHVIADCETLRDSEVLLFSKR